MDLRRTFQHLPGLFLVVEPVEPYTVLAASDDYLHATHTDARILGKPLFEVFPDNPADPYGTGVRNLRASLEAVRATRARHLMPIQRYDVRRRGPHGTDFEERYWEPVNAPILDAAGNVEYIIHRVEDAGEPSRGNAGGHGRVRTTELIAESERLRRMYEAALDSTPDFFYVFDLDHRALYANDALRRVWGVEDVRGKHWLDLGYEQWHADRHDAEIDQVIRTRAPIHSEIPFTGTNGRRMYDYIFAPVFGDDGAVVAVAGVTRDVTERQAAEQALREQAERLAESDRAKDEFLATLSHELRNPLAPLRNGLALLHRELGEGALEPVHSMMQRQVNHLVRLVDDLLELSRISRGTLSLRRERVPLATVVRNAVETSEPLLLAGKHAFEVYLPDEPLWLDGDPVRLAQILANLLDNAAKYTEDGGHITLRAERAGTDVAISVRDNGLGISEEALPRMFEMFSRGDRDRGRTQGGLGIGLALARRLAQMHGGTLVARSAGPGHGSEFTLQVPLALQSALAVDDAPPAEADLTGVRVLVVDDNHDAGDSLRMLLELLGAQVRVARDGAEALQVFAEYRPPAVLLDIGMPGMNGYEVAQALRERFPDAAPVLVALTGWGQDDDRRRARDAGFDHHLVKPAMIETLLPLLARVQRDAA